MEGGLFLLFIIIAMVARAIEAMTKGEKGKRQPPQQRRPRPEYERPGGTTRPLPGARRELPSARSGQEIPRDATEDAAAEMIPDELWEILTGRPKPQRRPAPAWDEEADREEAETVAAVPVLYDEEAEYEKRRRIEEEERRRAHQELMERRRRGRDANLASKATPVVSLERPVPSAAARHRAFHEKIDGMPPVSVPTGRQASRREWLFAGDDMKRAIVLQEVLGTPKGLQ